MVRYQSDIKEKGRVLWPDQFVILNPWSLCSFCTIISHAKRSSSTRPTQRETFVSSTAALIVSKKQDSLAQPAVRAAVGLCWHGNLRKCYVDGYMVVGFHRAKDEKSAVKAQSPPASNGKYTIKPAELVKQLQAALHRIQNLHPNSISFRLERWKSEICTCTVSTLPFLYRSAKCYW